MPSPTCPLCDLPVPPAVLSGPPVTVFRCTGCNNVLTWRNGVAIASASAISKAKAAKSAAPEPKSPDDTAPSNRDARTTDPIVPTASQARTEQNEALDIPEAEAVDAVAPTLAEPAPFDWSVGHTPTPSANPMPMAPVPVPVPPPRSRRAAVVVLLAMLLVAGGAFALLRSVHTTPVEPKVATPAPVPEPHPAAEPAPPPPVEHEDPTPPPLVAVPPPPPKPTAPPKAPRVVAKAEPPRPAPDPKPTGKPAAKRVVLEYDSDLKGPGDKSPEVQRARELYRKGNGFLDAKDPAKAVAAYQDALKAFPGYVGAWRGLGLAYSVQHANAKAVAAFKTYLQAAPTAKDAALIKKVIDKLEK